MAVGDSLLFTARGDFGATDVTVEVIEPKTRDGNAVVDTQLTATSSGDFGPGAELRFFAQLPDGS